MNKLPKGGLAMFGLFAACSQAVTNMDRRRELHRFPDSCEKHERT